MMDKSIKAKKRKSLLENQIGLSVSALETEMLKLFRIAKWISDYHQTYDSPEIYKTRSVVDSAANLLPDVIGMLRQARDEIEECDAPNKGRFPYTLEETQKMLRGEDDDQT